MSQFFRDFQSEAKIHFTNITGIRSNAVSTIDHIYASPPVRLVHGHYILGEIKDITPLLVDVTYPNLRKNRYDLIPDLSLLGTNNSSYYLFNKNVPSYLNQLNKIDFDEYYEQFSCIAEHLLKQNDLESALERAKEIIKIYKLAVQSLLPYEFYKKLLIELYKLMGFEDHANLVKYTMVSFSQSGFISKFIPYLLKISQGEKFGLKYIIENSNIFNNVIFQPVGKNIVDITLSNLDLNLIIDLLENGSIIPNNQVFSWALAVTGVQHFGNDFGFFELLDNQIKEFNIENIIKTLQLTADKQDGFNFLEFINDESMYIDKRVSEVKMYKTQKKSSRINTINAFYIHLGRVEMQKCWQEFLRCKETRKIPMCLIR